VSRIGACKFKKEPKLGRESNQNELAIQPPMQEGYGAYGVCTTTSMCNVTGFQTTPSSMHGRILQLLSTFSLSYSSETTDAKNSGITIPHVSAHS